jgi:nicotinate-nucleotide--dimethylbenzimidazole phosphoribosyltransferase
MKQRESGLPFDDIRNLAKNLPDLDGDALNHTAAQLEGDDSDFAELCKWYSACSGRSPSIHRPAVTLFAGTHTLENMLDGGASSEELLVKVTHISEGSAYINRLCHQHDVGLKVFDLALQIPVDDISSEAALDEKSCAGTIAFGMEAIAGGADLLCVAALEVQPTFSALAILAVLGDVPIDDLMAIRGASDEASKTNLTNAISIARGQENNSLEVLRRLGGRETAAICGAILAARSQHIPVILDGYTALAAALVLSKLEPSSLDHVKLAQGFNNNLIDELTKQSGLQKLIPTSLTSVAEEGLLIGAGVLKSACLKLQGRP